MDNSTNNMSEKLVQYLDGELEGPEKQNLEQELSADKALQEELENLKAAREAVILYGLQQKVSGIHQQMMEEMQVPVRKISPTRRILRYSIAVAASVVLIIGGIFGYSFYTLSSNKVFTSNYHSYELSMFRSGDNQELTFLEESYNKKDYARVVSLKIDRPFTIEENFLRAMSYVELTNNDSAISEFKKVITENKDANTNFLKEEAEYYLALTYIRNKNYDLALDLLKSIKENPRHLYREKITAKLTRQVKMLSWR